MLDQLQARVENTSPPSLRLDRTFKRVTLLMILIFIGIWVLFHFNRPELTEPAVTALPSGIPAQKPSLFERWVPPSWGWLWRLKDSIFKRQNILLETIGIDGKHVSEEMLADLSLGNPAFTDTNGLKVWIASHSKLKEVLNRFVQSDGPAILFRPRIQTADGVQAQLYAGLPGPMPSGVSVGVLPGIRRNATDLSTTITVTETVTNQPTLPEKLNGKSNAVVSLRTNFAFAARIQLPNGSGAFVLPAGNKDQNEQPVCVIITAQVPAPKRR